MGSHVVKGEHFPKRVMPAVGLSPNWMVLLRWERQGGAADPKESAWAREVCWAGAGTERA